MSMFLWVVLFLVVVVPLILSAVLLVFSALGSLIDMFLDLVNKE